MSADLFDFEVDALAVDHFFGRSNVEPPSLVELASQQCELNQRAARRQRRDDIYRAFFAVVSKLPRGAAFCEFRNAYIAAFRALEVSEPSDPDQFFNKQVTCGCALCARAA